MPPGSADRTPRRAARPPAEDSAHTGVPFDSSSMKIGSPLPHKKARIEIIPLIDIMFFLLASFMMVSLTMIKMQSIKMDLPTATQAKRDFKPDIVNISVDKVGDIYIEKKAVSMVELHTVL